MPARLSLVVVSMLLALLHAPAGRAAGYPAYVIELPESVPVVLIAETATSTLYRLERDTVLARVADRLYMSIGENGAGKQRAWDRRTPLGVYFVVDQLDTSRLPAKYGITAYPLDYPNTLDRMAGRTGDGIWLHGVDPSLSGRPARDTDGCLALGNDDLAALGPDIVPLVTPVIVTPVVAYTTGGALEALRKRIRARLREWVSSFETGDLHGYESLYDDDFDFHGLSRDRWLALQLGRFRWRAVDSVSIDEVLLIRDPLAPDTVLARFIRTIVADGRAIRTTMRLYWRQAADGEYRIIAEDAG